MAHFHRFIGKFDFVGHHVKIFDEDLIEQIRKVLRLRIGDKITLCDGELNEALVEIEEMNKEKLSGKILEAWKNQNEPAKDVVLYCSILKRDNFELVVQKATEIGVKEIAPIICERTVKTGLRNNRLKKIIKEAAEQSGRGVVPKLDEAVSFEEALEAAQENDLNLFFDVNGNRRDWENRGDAGSVGIFIGPEGGWTEEEIKIAKNARFQIVSLGRLTLRSETAAIVGSYLACNF